MYFRSQLSAQSPSDDANYIDPTIKRFLQAESPTSFILMIKPRNGRHKIPMDYSKVRNTITLFAKPIRSIKSTSIQSNWWPAMYIIDVDNNNSLNFLLEILFTKVNGAGAKVHRTVWNEKILETSLEKILEQFLETQRFFQLKILKILGINKHKSSELLLFGASWLIILLRMQRLQISCHIF